MKNQPPQLTVADLAMRDANQSQQRAYFRHGGVFGVLSAMAGLGILTATLMTNSVAWVSIALIGFSLLCLAQGIANWKSWTATPLWIEGLTASIAGVVLLGITPLGSISPTAVLSAFLLVSGIAQSMLAESLNPAKGWGWWLTSGALVALAGVWGLMGTTGNRLWILTTVFGFNILANGLWQIFNTQTEARDDETQRHARFAKTLG